MSRKGRTQNFKDVIAVMAADIDWKQMVVDIAMEHPASVIEAAAKQDKAFGWKVDCKSLVLEGEKIQAIKHCRNMTGMGLKEARDAVLAL